MSGSWSGAMGHTEWTPEVRLNVGMDVDRDGGVSPFGTGRCLGFERTILATGADTVVASIGATR